MARLITLKLQPVPRSATQPALLPPSHTPPPIPAKSHKRREMIMSPALSLPQTQQQWRAALDEVRNSYLMKRYKQCSTRCIQLLEGAPEMVLVLHHIYFSFYAAICLELQARALPDSYQQKLSIFNHARSYYKKAADYMWNMECGHIFPNTKLGWKSSQKPHQHFHTSSLDSSETSERSSAATSPTLCTFSPPLNSPASSVCSSISKFEEEPLNSLKVQPLRVRKSATFYLGYAEPAQVRSNGALNNVISSNHPLPEVQNISSKLDSHFGRFNIHLSTLHTQLTHHLSSITQLITTLETRTQTQHLELSPRPPSITPTEQQANLPISVPLDKKNLRGEYQQDSIQSESQKQQLQQQQRVQDRAARIAALKQRGEDWKRGKGRFDAKKYERLCEEALRDLVGGRAGNYC